MKGAIEAARLERGQPRAEGGLLAIVVRDAVSFGLARAYGAAVEGVRQDVLVTYLLTNALDWLCYDEAERRRISEFVAAARVT